jgi:hypothetical protein
VHVARLKKHYYRGVDMKSVLHGLVASIVAVSMISSCGKKKEDEAAAPSATDDPAGVTSTNPLAIAYPTSLSINAFPTANTTLAMSEMGLEETTAEKNTVAAKILKGEATSCVPEALKEVKVPESKETCYEFDQDMIYGSLDGGMTFKGTKDGKDSSGEACLVSFARGKVKRVVGAVDRSLGMIQMMMCQAKKAGTATELAAAGDSVDLAEALKAGDAKMVPTTAKVTRLDDVVDGANIYKNFKSEVVVTRRDGVTMEITLFHVAKDTSNKEFYGVLQLAESLSAKEGAAEGADSVTGKKRMMTISYGRDEDDAATPSIAYELRNGIFDSGVAASAFGTDKLLDFNAGASFTGSSSLPAYGSYAGFTQNNLAVFGITYIAFAGNPDTNVGTFSYWQNPGSNYTENARGMVAELKLTDGLLNGCAYSGATGYSPSTGFSIRQALKESKTLTPKGFYHPFFSSSTGNGTDTVGTYYTKTQGPSTAKWYRPEATTNGLKFVSDQMANLITKQCYKQDATTKAYLIDTSIITSAKGYDFVETEASKSAIEPPKQIFTKL